MGDNTALPEQLGSKKVSAPKFFKRLRKPLAAECRIDDEAGLPTKSVGKATKQKKTASSAKVYVCEICNATFQTLSNRHAHFKKDHPTIKPYLCGTCGMRLTSNCALRNHQVLHGKVKPHQCSVCQKAFTTTTKLKNHERIHSGEKPFSCECGKAFTEVRHLREHQRVHSGEKPCICPTCGKGFRNHSQLHSHKLVHRQDRAFECDLCEMKLRSRGSLRQHRRTHTGEKPYTCGECGKSFAQVGSYKAHERIHTGITPYKCEICEKTFNLRSLLKVHTRTHTGEKPYVCSSCGRKFHRLDSLKYHERGHSGDTPYMCATCAKGFKSSRELKMHEKRVHTLIRSYICNVCDKGFVSGSELRIHKEIHSGQKPYECQGCSRRFTQLQQMRFHQRKNKECSVFAPTRRKKANENAVAATPVKKGESATAGMAASKVPLPHPLPFVEETVLVKDSLPEYVQPPIYVRKYEVVNGPSKPILWGGTHRQAVYITTKGDVTRNFHHVPVEELRYEPAEGLKYETIEGAVQDEPALPHYAAIARTRVNIAECLPPTHLVQPPGYEQALAYEIQRLKSGFYTSEFVP